MIERISFRVFLLCLFPTATLMIYQMWALRDGPDSMAPILMQIAFTLFVIGLTSFLIWFSSMLYRIRERIANRQ